VTDLAATAAALVAPGRGILAADGSTAALSARLAAAGIVPTAGNRQAYREMLVATPGLARGISGVIVHAEALRQRWPGGQLLPAALAGLGLLTGVRADTGPGRLARTPGETVTEGLDGLLPRLLRYAALGARFATWRAALRIGPGMPSPLAIRANGQALGRFASAAQAAGLVPVAEVEILGNGPHSLGRCETVTSIVLLGVLNDLHDYGASFPGVVLRPSMVRAGQDTGPGGPGPAEVAEVTLGALGGVPATLAGVAFLSGGQDAGVATACLAAMQHPLQVWPLTFAFGRALTGPALAAWRGDPARRPAGQQALARRVALNVAAITGRYTPSLEAGGPGPLLEPAPGAA
jgi:fructose-bisphosphate aldolase, class I